jgi:NADH-quinone oxidoreductase E subunit
MRNVDDIIARYADGGREALIPLLQAIQAEEGYLSAAVMDRVAAALGVPSSRVFGVATFYNQFRFVPLGAHVIQVCRGTACHVKGSLTLAQHLERTLKLRKDGNSPDGRFTVVTVACLGACSIAPVIKLDGEFYGHLTAESLERLLAETAAADADADAAKAGEGEGEGAVGAGQEGVAA